MKALIVAVDQGFGIGKDGNIPWHYSEDMKFFSTTTKGSTCIMGRKTYDDLAEIFKDKKGLLPGRECIVVTSTPETVEKGIAVSAVKEAVDIATRENVFFIGGASIYEAAVDYIDKAFITFIPGDHDCDVEISEVVRRIEQEFIMADTKQSEVGGLLFAEYIDYNAEAIMEEFYGD